MNSATRSESKGFGMPRTVTCQVLSPANLKDVSSSLVQLNDFREQANGKANDKSSLILAGLHACGDLSVTMLRYMVLTY